MSTTLSSRLLAAFCVIAAICMLSIEAQLTAGTGTATWASPTNGTPTVTSLYPPSPTNTETSSAQTQLSSSLALFSVLITAALFSL